MGVLISWFNLITMFINWSLKEGTAHGADVIGDNSNISRPIEFLGKRPCYLPWDQPLQV